MRDVHAGSFLNRDGFALTAGSSVISTRQHANVPSLVGLMTLADGSLTVIKTEFPMVVEQN